jgi:hypothetical protein
VDLGQQTQHQIVTAPVPVVDSKASEALVDQSNKINNRSVSANTVKSPTIIVNKSVARAASFISNGAPSPQLEPDDQVRRFTRYGVGVTMKVSLDANQAIYGRSPSAVGRNSRITTKTRTKQNAQHELVLRLSTPVSDDKPRLAKQPNAGQKKGAPRQSRDYQFPPRKSSLPNSPDDQVKETVPRKKGQSFGSRLARPTAASAAREAEAKKEVANTKAAQSLDQSGNPDTLTSIKRASGGFRSRFTSFLPGRRRSESTDSFAVKEQERYTAVPEDSSPGRAPILRKTHSRNPTPYMHAAMGRSSTNVARVDPEGQLSTDAADKLDQSKSHKERKPPDEYHAFQSQMTAVSPNNLASLQPHRRDDRNTPAQSRGGPAGHYGEGVGKFNYDAVGEHIDSCVRDAENHLRRILEIGQGIQDQDMRSNVTKIAESLGEAIQTTRSLRMAAIAAATANANLAMATESLSAAAATAVGNVGAN